MKNDLQAFWRRADLDVPVFTGDEYKRLTKPIRGLLEKNGLIRRAENATAIECDACGDGHIETVEMFVEPASAGPRAYINCPENGRVAVYIDRLQQWRVDVDALATTVCTALNPARPPVVTVPGRIWLLGTHRFGKHARDIFMIRGINWPDACQILESTPRLNSSPCPLILCLSRFPNAPEWQELNRVVVSLSETEWLGLPQPSLAKQLGTILAEYEVPRAIDALPPTPVQERPRLMERICNRYAYRVKDIYTGAQVDRSYLNKWKLGKVPDSSEPSQRIENFLRRHRHVRRVPKIEVTTL